MGARRLQAELAMDMRDTLAQKLRMARRATGMSTWTVAEKLKKRFRISVSHATIANHEKGKFSPSIELLSALAELYERPVNWLLDNSAILTGVHYRNLPSRVRVADRHRFEGEVLRWLCAYVNIERRLDQCLLPTEADFHAKENEAPDELARRLRTHLQFKDTEPIPSVVELLERFGIRVIEQPTDLRIDGLAARFGSEYAVVLNPTVSNDRSRLNAAHELGHVLYGDCDTDSSQNKSLEERAFQFASHLILPNRQLKHAFEGQSMVRLVQFKERYGISLAAMVYRAEQLRIIKKSVAKRLWIEFAKRGWRSCEPGQVKADRATRFEQLLDAAFFEQRLTLQDAASVAGVRIEEIHRRIDLAIDGQSKTASDANDQPIFKFFPTATNKDSFFKE